MDAVAWNRFQFGFTATYHYLFPQLTMGLALVIVILKAMALRTGQSRYDDAARFWARLFAINFAMGVVSGIPLEFQFGTNFARFSNYTGGVIGLTLAMEGMFAFFAESTFLGLFLYGEKRLGPKGHFFTACMVCAGAWLSGYFIVATNAFMQHPVGYVVTPDGKLQLNDVLAFVFNPWAIWQYAHTMCASMVTACFVVAAVGAYYSLSRAHEEQGNLFLRVAVPLGLLFCLLQLFPTGDLQGKMVAKHQVPTLAGMEGKFESGDHAEMAIIGQPDMKNRRLENPIVVPWMLSFLAYGSFGARVTGLNDIPLDQQPDNVPLLYFSYHIMAGLGTILILVMGGAAFLLWRGTLMESRPMLWILMLAFPFPYIATTAGWLTAELGRQPWSVYGLMRTEHATSPLVSSGNVAFTTLGFMGMYLAMGIVFLYLVGKVVSRGPVPAAVPHSTHAKSEA